MEHLPGGASPESSGDTNTSLYPSGSHVQPASGSSGDSQLPTRHAGGTTFDRRPDRRPEIERENLSVKI